jgi:hypothetical protein
MATKLKGDAARRDLAARYKAEELIPVSISPFYRGHLGSNLCLSLNGIPVYVRVNGQTHYIPKSYADLLAQKLKRVDIQTLRQGMMSETSINLEQSPGALKFF